jgi:hypothetical protein
MNNIIKILLGGAALSALATAPAIAGDAPHFSITALHAGNAVFKSKLQVPGRKNVTYTVAVSTYVPASDLGTAVHLLGTYYKFNSNSSLCTTPKMKIKVPKKSTYAKLGHATETYSEGCASGPTKFYGDTYDLKKAKGEGKVDSFVSVLTAKFKNSRGKYNGTLNLDVKVSIGA